MFLKKNILVIAYDKEISSYDYFNKFDYYEITFAEDYEDFKELFKKQSFDICLVNIDNHEERNFIIFYILHLKENQKILQVYENNANCFFYEACKMCEKYNIKSLSSPTKDKINDFLDSFEIRDCEFMQLRIS